MSLIICIVIVFCSLSAIPLRAFSEGLGMNVLWDGENYIVNIDSKKY